VLNRRAPYQPIRAELQLPKGLTAAETKLCEYFDSLAKGRKLTGVAPLLWAVNQTPANYFEKLILMTLASYANRFGLCFPSQATIAKRAIISVDTLQRYLPGLVAGGFIYSGRRLTNGRRLTIRLMVVLFDKTARDFAVAIEAERDQNNDVAADEIEPDQSGNRDDTPLLAASWPNSERSDQVPPIAASCESEVPPIAASKIPLCSGISNIPDNNSIPLKAPVTVNGPGLDAERGLGEGSSGESVRTCQAKPVFVEVDSPQWDAWLEFRGDAPATISRKICGEQRSGYMFASPWPPGFDDHAEVAP